MNKQTDDTRDIYSVSEDVRADGEKTHVKRDSKSVYDDMGDYVFLKPRRRRHSHSGSSSSGHRRHHHKKHLKRWQKVLIGVGCGLLALIVAVVGTVFGLILKGQSELFSKEINIVAPDIADVQVQVQDSGDYIVYEGETYQLNKNITSMLFMGVDKNNLEDTYDVGGGMGQADSIVLMAMDTESGVVKMISVPRDTMTDVALYSAGGTYTGTQEMQICLSYAYGDGKETSCENTVASVKRLFYNIPINTYYALDIDGLIYLNDAIGGVDVVSPNTLTTEGSGGDVTFFEEGQSYHLEGQQAERFVRARGHRAADESMKRLERQKAYVTSFLKQGIEQTKRDLSVPVNLFNASAPYSCTNLNPAKVSYLAKEVVTGSGMTFEFVSVPGTVSLNEEEYAEFRIDEKAFFEMFLSVYYEKIER